MNKRANLSTMVFVMMVVVVCLLTIFAFAKHRNIMDQEMVSLDSVNYFALQESAVKLQLKIFGDEAIFYAYNETIKKMSYDYMPSNDSSKYFIFDFTTFNEENYRAIFKSEFLNKFGEFVNLYPENISRDKEIKDILKTTQIDFDGEKISLTADFSLKDKSFERMKASLTKKIAISSSLKDYNLTSLSKVDDIWNICPANNVERRQCILDTFPGFNFAPDPGGVKFIRQDIALQSRFLIKLISNNSYFFGSDEPEKIILYFTMPINFEQQDILSNNVEAANFFLPTESSF